MRYKIYNLLRFPAWYWNGCSGNDKTILGFMITMLAMLSSVPTDIETFLTVISCLFAFWMYVAIRIVFVPHIQKNYQKFQNEVIDKLKEIPAQGTE